jgi:hypothetical protein
VRYNYWKYVAGIKLMWLVRRLKCVAIDHDPMRLPNKELLCVRCGRRLPGKELR